MVAVLHHDVVGATLDDRGGRNEREPRLLLQLLNRERAAVAHRGLDLVQRGVHAVLERAGIGHVGVDALLEGKLSRATEVITLPVASTSGTLAPVLLHVLAVHVHAGCGALIEAREVAAKHEEVGAHGERKRHVVVIDDTAVGAHGHIDTGLLEVFIASAAHIDKRRGLTTTDTLGFARDADGAAADTDLDEVGTAIGQEAERPP